MSDIGIQRLRAGPFATLPAIEPTLKSSAEFEVDAILVTLVASAPTGIGALASCREDGRHGVSISELGFRISDFNKKAKMASRER